MGTCVGRRPRRFSHRRSWKLAGGLCRDCRIAASARLRSGDSQLGMMTAKAISVTSRPASIFQDSLTVDLWHLACQLKIKSCFLKKTLDFETEALVYR